jgi:hypothetical protein
MAPDQGEDIDPTEASHGPQECMPCRGTGRVVSNLGGSASKVTCPWCQGDGVRRPEIDAQASWLNSEGAEGQDAGSGAAAEEAA